MVVSFHAATVDFRPLIFLYPQQVLISIPTGIVADIPTGSLDGDPTFPLLFFFFSVVDQMRLSKTWE